MSEIRPNIDSREGWDADIQYAAEHCACCGEHLAECECEDWDECAEYWDAADAEYDQFRDDVEADADVLRMAGWGTDEDYGYFGEDEYM